ncbi:MAG TPA: elongation factor P [bacterium]|nr:elongation factor P [bacterium]HPT29486.1 elongation factor P [bacterium]
MLGISEIKIGRVLVVNGEPYVVSRTDHHKMGRGGAVLKIKLRNLISGNILERTVQGSEKVEEAQTQTQKANFLYKDANEANFMNNNSFEQFSLPLEDLGDKAQYLKEGTDVDALYFNDKPVAISLPIKMEFKVVSAPPAIKGNSVGSVTKIAELETGAKVNVPVFISEGEIIRINTDTGEYVERA